MHTGPKANTNKTQTSRFTWFPKTGYVHGGSRLYINGGMIQTLNSTQYNPTKPSVSLFTRCFSQIYTCTLSQSCTVFFSLHFTTHTALSCTLFIGEWRSIGSNPCAEPTTTMTKVMVVGERLTKMLTIATNLHLGKIFPSNPRDQSMLPLTRHMALHPEGAQHREMLTKSKQCWNLIPETHFVSMSAGLSAVPIFCSRISPSSTISRTK